MLKSGVPNPRSVKALQEALLVLGYDLGEGGVYNDGVDGNFGPNTEDAVIQFQLDRGFNATNVDGIQISEFLPNLSNHMNNLSIIRSMYSTQGAHAQGKYFMHTGYQQRGSVVHPTLGSWSMYHQGKINKTLPGNVVIEPFTNYPYSCWISPELGAIPLDDATKVLQNINRPRDITEQRYHDQLELSYLFDKAFQKKYC